MGFGDFMTSTSQATDSRIAATDQARVTKGNVGQSVETGAVGVSGGGTLLGAGAKQTTVKVAAGKNSNVVVQDMNAAVAQEAMNRISGLAGAFGQSLEDFMTSANANALELAAVNAESLRTTQDSLLASQAQQEAEQQKGLSGILDKFAALVGDQAPSGDAQKNKIVLYVVLAVLALVGAIFYFRK
jgi:hypothetical protein